MHANQSHFQDKPVAGSPLEENRPAENRPVKNNTAQEQTPLPPAADTATPPAADVADSPLANEDLAVFFGASGPLAAELSGYELRPSQLAMAEAIKRAILSKKHALVEAPTGTGKSIAYLVPAILSGKTVVVATANKSLQSQLFFKDIPFLRTVLGREITAVVVKGRSNFVCNYKWEKEAAEQQQIALYDREHEQVTFLRRWLDETETGDVDDLPFLLDSDLRPRIVSYPDDCLHDDCRFFYEGCWVNQMRDQAANAQILVTNHHLLLNALELGWAGERLLPPASIYVVDEAHGLEQTATAVFETSITDYTVEQFLSRTDLRDHVDESEIDESRFQNTLAFQEVAHLSRDNAFRIDDELEEMKKLSRGLSGLAQKLKLNHPYNNQSASEMLSTFEGDESAGDSVRPANSLQRGRKRKKQQNGPAASDEEVAEKRRAYDLLIEALNSTATKLMTVAVNSHSETVVRYAIRVFDRRHTTLEIHAAPIHSAADLSQCLFHPEVDGEAVERTVICTSATLATNGTFAHFKQRCGIEEVGEEAILPAVFDYPKQALLYQPELPAYNYRNANTYYSKVSSEIERLLQVSRGRALCLFTSWSGLQQVKDRLSGSESPTFWPLRAQGDAPRDALLTWFKETDHSVLLATRSFWEGVDIPGEDLSLVVLDKMPFPTPNDPLHSARMKVLDESGSSSFGEYMLPLMNLALKQGFGRLIRRANDSGVVAILDERLSSKGYGRQTRQDLPPARFSREFKDVHKFYQTVFASPAEFALNVWSWQRKGTSAGATARDPFALDTDGERESHSNVVWRWQLLRLQDGKADQTEGTADAVAAEGDPPPESCTEGELYAVVHGLENLRDRIERAGRSPSDFAVEIRCQALDLAAPSAAVQASPFFARWQSEGQRWQQIHVVRVQRSLDK
ncbi:MAG: ATP-dependent DNA helicase [Caldilineaceae bacterium]|nr:ATP-dependent DNA helicase [Caldilineaceae bacterium]